MRVGRMRLVTPCLLHMRLYGGCDGGGRGKRAETEAAGVQLCRSSCVRCLVALSSSMSLFTVIPQGPFESKCRKQLSLSSCGWVLIRPGQFKITLVAELGIQPLLRSFWTETSAITFSTFSIAVTVFLRPPTVATGA